MSTIITPNSSASSLDQRSIYQTDADCSKECPTYPASQTAVFAGNRGHVKHAMKFTEKDQFIGGRIDAGPYDLYLDLYLGRGAYGEVYRARCQRTGRVFALKTIRATVLTAGVRQKVEREVQLQARCAGHPGILTVYGIITVASTQNESAFAYDRQCVARGLAMMRRHGGVLSPGMTDLTSSNQFSLQPPRLNVPSSFDSSAYSLDDSVDSHNSDSSYTSEEADMLMEDTLTHYTARMATVPDGWYILLEYCDGGDLFHCLTRGLFNPPTTGRSGIKPGSGVIIKA
jgi:serine/threonine protein kinase